MNTIPSMENILLQIHQSLGGLTLSSKQKEKFALGLAEQGTHEKVARKVFDDIFDALELNPLARADLLGIAMDLINFNKTLEHYTWTYAADQRQVLWQLLTRSYTPWIARYAAFWNLEEAVDKGMPGGRFWYLPERREQHGEVRLYLPVAQVVDWLRDLLAMPQEEFASQRNATGDEDDKGTEGLIRSFFYNWRDGTTPKNADVIARYFPDNMRVEFRGTFTPSAEQPLSEQLASACAFVQRKQLSTERLRHEIPMTAPGRLEAVLEGNAGPEEQALFVQLLAERYAAPSPRMIRQRLRFARMVQHGYKRLLALLCPDVDWLCADPDQNKLLQLFDIYKLIYNTRIDAWRHCHDQGELAENAWFEAHLPQGDKERLCLAILPSRQDTACRELAGCLTRYFAECQPGVVLEDVIGRDAQVHVALIKRDLERVRAHAEETQAAAHLFDQLKLAPPWRKLRGESRYWVVREMAANPQVGSRARAAAIQRLHELAASPFQTMDAIMVELAHYFDDTSARRSRDSRKRVDALLANAPAQEGYEIRRAEILHYQAKHLLACNEFDAARKCLREAHEATLKRSCGPLRGEVARDLFALEVADQKLIPGNHQKYYRDMLNFGTFPGKAAGIEDTARWVAEYFWKSLYKPYAGVESKKPMLAHEAEALWRDPLPLIETGDWDELRAWMKRHRKLFRAQLHYVTGDSAIMNWIKGRTALLQRLQSIEALVPVDLKREQARMATLLENFREAIRLLAEEAPQQLALADYKGQTPLMLMAEAGDLELVRSMLAAGAKPDQQDYEGRVALHSAAASGALAVARELLEHGADPTKQTFDGQSVLHTAVRAGNLELVELLLDRAAALAQQRNDVDMTPLDLAEELRAHPEARDELTNHMARQGRRSATEQALDVMIEALKQAAPTAKA